LSRAKIIAGAGIIAKKHIIKAIMLKASTVLEAEVYLN